jgi:SAM-dependent methyltransferase
MLKSEARWLGERMMRWSTQGGVILNIGSSSGRFRTEVQPWIDRDLFGPARARGLRVVHHDLFPAPGVDIAGDLLSDECQACIRELDVYGVVCSNVLEHVPDRDRFAQIIARIVPSGGRALVTVPNAFPYHPDPIDTGYRPDVDSLAALFPELKCVEGELLDGGRLLDLVVAQPGRVIRRRPTGPEETLPARRWRDWLPYLIRSFQSTCIEFERPV